MSTAKPLDDFSLQVLQALYNDNKSPDTDDVVWHIGQRLFGNGWGGTKTRAQAHGMDYAPVVSMRLGALAKRGLVVKKSTSFSYSTWEISAGGRQTLIEYGIVSD